MCSIANQKSHFLYVLLLGLLILVILPKLNGNLNHELDLSGERGTELEDFSTSPGNGDLISDLNSAAAAPNDYIASSPTCFCCRAFACHRQKRCPCSRYFF